MSCRLMLLLLAVATSSASAGKIYPYINAGGSGAPIGVEAVAYALVKDTTPSANLHLMYQFRVYSNAGKPGQVLGDKTQPTRAYVLNANQTKRGNDIQLRARFDVVRDQLSGARGLPKVTQDTTVFIAVEAQVYDSRAKKYLTPSLTPPLMLAARVTRFGRVYQLEHFADWFSRTVKIESRHQEAIGVFKAMVNTLPVYRHNLISTYEDLLESKSIPQKTK